MIGAYVTREAVMAASEIKASAYAAPEIDRACEAASRRIDKLCHRGDDIRPGFGQWTGTLSFDYPNMQNAGLNRLWLDNHNLISLTSMTSGDNTVPAASVLLYPNAGPPYSRVEISQATSYALSEGLAGWQNSLALTGVWGYSGQTYAAGTLAASATSSTTTITTSQAQGVCGWLLAGTEWMLVTDRTAVSSTVTIGADLTGNASATSVTVASTATFRLYEDILIDAERMQIVDMTPTTLIVRRAWNGSALAAHVSGTAVYWYHQLTVQRGVLGTTAVAHSSGDAVARQYIPEPIRTLALGWALDQFFQEGAAYARVVGQGDSQQPVYGKALDQLAEGVRTVYGRIMRFRTV